MDVSNLYQFVLMFVLVGVLIGVGVLTLDKFATSSGVTGVAAIAINSTRSEIATISSSWLGLIITIGVMAMIISLVIGSFVIRGRR